MRITALTNLGTLLREGHSVMLFDSGNTFEMNGELVSHYLVTKFNCEPNGLFLLNDDGIDDAVKDFNRLVENSTIE